MRGEVTKAVKSRIEKGAGGELPVAIKVENLRGMI